MNAVISGTSRRALLVDGNSLASFEIDEPTNLIARKPSDLSFLFGEARDLRVIQNTDLESIVKELRSASDFTTALDLALISFDEELDGDIRSDALTNLEVLLGDSEIAGHLENVLYARPMPDDGDLAGALDLCYELNLQNTYWSLLRLQKRQTLIGDVNGAWNAIPTKIFGGHDRRTAFHHAAIRAGLFRDFVITIEALHGNALGKDAFVRIALGDEWIKRLPKNREVLQAWGRMYGKIAEASQIAKLNPANQTARLTRAAAATDAAVLLMGESGTGKSTLARMIHEQSRRSGMPFISFCCGAIPEDLIESELFGHARGSFTGADRGRRGLLETADGGTIFLDEITALPLSAQVKLLFVLQEHEIRRMASNQRHRIDVRVMASTARNLEEEVRAGRFRQDLYYRLNVRSVSLPPLRERPEEISSLASQFLNEAAEKFNRKGMQLHPLVLRAFESYAWPGNLREMKYVIERMVVMSSGKRIGLDFLPKSILSVEHPDSLSMMKQITVADFERRYIQNLLKKVNGDQRAAAKLLGIKRKELLKLIYRLGLLTSPQTRSAQDSSD